MYVFINVYVLRTILSIFTLIKSIVNVNTNKKCDFVILPKWLLPQIYEFYLRLTFYNIYYLTLKICKECVKNLLS